MSTTLPVSPAKLERVERHLIRQRGAGVRNLATSFGFSLGLPVASIVVSDRTEEPPAKRRKSNNTRSEERALGETFPQPEEGAAKIKSKIRRRFEAVVDDEAPIIRDVGGDSFSTTAKKRRRPKKTQIHVEVDEVPARGILSERRPRRQAAANALSKVTEGFAEEAQPIDRKRRNPEPVRPARKGRKKTVPVVATEAELVITNTQAGHEEPEEGIVAPQQEQNHHVDIKGAKASARSTKLKPMESPVKRIPLGETHANIPSKSPEKRAEKMEKEIAGSCSPPASPIKKGRSIVTTKHSSKKLGEDVQTSRSARNVAAVASAYSSLEDCRRNEMSTNKSERYDEASGLVTTPAKLKPRSKTSILKSRKAALVEEAFPNKDCENVGKAAGESSLPTPPIDHSMVSSSNVLQKSRMQEPRPEVSEHHLKDSEKHVPKLDPPGAISSDVKIKERSAPAKQKGPRQSKRADKAESRTPTKLAEEFSGQKQDEDVDWLFETSTKRKVPPRPSKRKVPAKTAQRAQSPEVDLDDMLSNIASWAPRGR